MLANGNRVIKWQQGLWGWLGKKKEHGKMKCLKESKMRIIKKLKILQLKTMSIIARMSPCIASKWGLTGAMSAEFIDGKYKGMPIVIALAIEKIEKS